MTPFPEKSIFWWARLVAFGPVNLVIILFKNIFFKLSYVVLHLIGFNR